MLQMIDVALMPSTYRGAEAGNLRDPAASFGCSVVL